MNNKNWDDIRFALAVARTGSLNSAASKLNVTHATVMRRVAAFEASIDQQMFLKSPSGYKLRPEARSVLRAMENIEDAMLAMDRTIAGTDQSLSGTVRIASTDSLCNLVLPGIIARISHAHTRIDLTLFSANQHHDLSRLSADIVVRATNHLDDTLSGQNVGTVRFATFHNGSADLKWMRLEGALTGSVAAEWMAKNISPDQLTSGADSFAALQQMAVHGIGKALLPEFVGKADDRLEMSKDDRPAMGVRLWVALLKEFAHVPRFSTVQNMLANELRKSELFAG